ncbi:WG repeat-containing protein [Psychrobacter frigidicola]|uniref:WG repeat-containing protein n=1 Tax=Psychrobacter frigidicola TaxID=45611 RepID=A0A5C7A456_9GAMM|nr:WG repeat-containing protein [Psychrobacter frigidicola]TXD97888.1 WG repeat-containing protein [Psychrobacter frigidicola]
MDQRSIFQYSVSQSSLGSALKKSEPLSTTLVNKSLLNKTPRLMLGISVLLSAIFAMPTAQAASCKLPKSYYKNVSCTPASGYFLAIKDFGAPVALIDSRGKVAVDLSRYQKVDVNKMAGGLFPVLRNGRVGYINMQGQEVIPPNYDILSGGQGWARPVSDGRIVVKKSSQYGVISTGNDTIVPFSSAISDIDNYRGGVARVRKNKAVSWVDKNGKATTDPNAKVSSRNDTRSDNRNERDISARSVPTNKTTNEVDVRNNVSEIAPEAPRRLAEFSTLQPHQQDGRWGFIDEDNVIMITYSFDEVRPFSEGVAGVRVDDKWGFLNLGGELVIPFTFEDSSIITTDNDKEMPAFVFKNGKAWVSNLDNGAKICIDIKGDYASCI